MIKGESHRGEDEPSTNYYLSDGTISGVFYCKNNKLHRENGPAVIQYFEDGQIKSEEYFLNGEYFESDSPSKIEYYSNGNVYLEIYKNFTNKQGKITKCFRYSNGNMKREEYQYECNDKMLDNFHRLDGPAIIDYDMNGKVVNEEYFINGKQYDELSYYVKINSSKLLKN